MLVNLVAIAYVISGVLFITALRGLSSPETSRTGNMLGMAEIIAFGALNRKESRGGHSRTDYPKRDDKNFLNHLLLFHFSGVLDLY